jgi:hypothetical protein
LLLWHAPETDRLDLSQVGVLVGEIGVDVGGTAVGVLVGGTGVGQFVANLTEPELVVE